MRKSSTVFVGMDVHKDSVDIAIAEGEGEVRHYGAVGGDAASVNRVVRKLRAVHHDLVFVYEAGPCGFWLQRRLTARGLRCMVVWPSMTPRRAGERVKTDRRDALKLARLARAGEVTAIYVQDKRDEAGDNYLDRRVASRRNVTATEWSFPSRLTEKTHPKPRPLCRRPIAATYPRSDPLLSLHAIA